MSISDSAPRRQWHVVDPARPGDRLVCAALAAYRVAIREGRYTLQHESGGAEHLGRRLDERSLDMADVLSAVAWGQICAFALRAHDQDWIGGGYLLGEIMVYVQAPAPRGLSFYDLVPSICSAWRIDPLECQPFAVPLSELACAHRGVIADGA